MRLDSPRNRYMDVMSTLGTATPQVPPPRAPEPLDLSHYYSRVTNKRSESSIKEFYKYFAIPGIGNLAGGTLYCSCSTFFSEPRCVL